MSPLWENSCLFLFRRPELRLEEVFWCGLQQLEKIWKKVQNLISLHQSCFHRKNEGHFVGLLTFLLNVTKKVHSVLFWMSLFCSFPWHSVSDWEKPLEMSSYSPSLAQNYDMCPLIISYIVSMLWVYNRNLSWFCHPAWHGSFLLRITCPVNGWIHKNLIQ